MKKLFSILLLAFSVANLSAQKHLQISSATGNSCPTNLNHENFNNIRQFEGKVVAFDGIIERLENSGNNTPFYKLRLSDDYYLWTVLMFKNNANSLGDTIRVVGYVRPAIEPNDNEKEYLDGKYMVIAFGLLDFKNSNLLFAKAARKQKKEWIDGNIPTSK
jgi:hypothetical protein